MNGTNTYNSAGVFGTQGVFVAGNMPPAFYEAAEWTDLNGNFWLFGGVNAGSNFGDLWEFNPAINQWAWIKGPGISQQSGVYGTITVASPVNNPGCRGWGAATWVDQAGDLWLFGGNGFDAVGGYGRMDDMWKYNIASNQWTWMNGPNTINNVGNYGTILVTAPTNVPKARNECNASWTDANNNLWLFGGHVYNQANPNCHMADTWKYNIATNEWTWMKGQNIFDQPATYGIIMVPNPANNPTARAVYSKWKDNNGDFWFFGGANSLGATFNDLWKYSIANNTWTWMNGPNTSTNTTAINAGQCTTNNTNMPGCRFENRASWTRNCENFEIFGGFNNVNNLSTLNDLWNYNVACNEWTQMSGSTTPNQPSVFGTITVSSPANMPGSRCGSIGWKDNAGNLWMYGGLSDGTMATCMNDMWRFVPDTTCPHLCISNAAISSFTASPLSGCGPLTVTFTNTTTNGSGYLWAFGDGDSSIVTNPVHTYVDTGTYIVTLNATSACNGNGSSSTDTITVTNGITVNLPPDSSICSGGSIKLNAGNPGLNYLWSDGETTDTITVSTSGLYGVTVSSGGCTATDTVTITIRPPLDLHISNDTSICPPDQITLSVKDVTDVTGYSWIPGGQTSPSIIVNQPGTYGIEIIDKYGCIARGSIWVRDFCPGELYVPNAFSPTGNGINDYFLAYGEGIEQFKMYVFNRWGQQIFESNDMSLGWDGTFNGDDCPQGIYVWKIEYSMYDYLTLQSHILVGKVTLIR
jgi:gliding motility-associated-like protein